MSENELQRIIGQSVLELQDKTRLPGFAPNTKQVADGGVDGRAVLATKPDNYNSRLALAQIKGGKFSLSSLRDFIGVTNRDKAALGCYVTLEPVSTPASRIENLRMRARSPSLAIRIQGCNYGRSATTSVTDFQECRL